MVASTAAGIRLEPPDGSPRTLSALATPADLLEAERIGPELSPLWIPGGSQVRLVLWRGAPVALLRQRAPAEAGGSGS
ncbi:MAG: hypothetical protein QJR14_01235 [Bacillota bacterium]|nr:hypothetical protein [Bacillota bacterium]